MADWEIWGVIGALALSTALTRSAFALIGHRVAIPKRVHEMLRFAPACALAAIVVPDLVLGAGREIALSPANPRLVAGLFSVGFYMLRRDMLQTIGFGMLAFTLLRVFHIFAPAA